MHVSRLSLADFRNYRRLELELPASAVVLLGDNAQGKTNLVEAVYLLATTRSHRTSSDGELLCFDARGDDLPVARVAADVERVRGGVRVEVLLRAEPRSGESGGGGPAPVRKQVRVNGLRRRSADVVGQTNVVLFAAQDIELATGKSALCRRYLDVVNCQMDRDYLRSLQRYQKVLVQRNHLLKLLQQGQAGEDQLDFWDRELVSSGAFVIRQRRRAVEALQGHAREIHRDISGGEEDLQVAYAPSVAGGGDLPEIEGRFREELEGRRRRETLQGMTLAGPHRDSLAFTVNGIDVTRFGSRGQQETVVLSLKMAEARHLLAETGDHPIVLLDDVFSELDRRRREHLLGLAGLHQQVLITATDADCFEPAFLAGATRFRVSRGVIGPA